ncbi:hypothetical protein ACFVYD_16140 [Streptomyces sp. NPDC058301]|uniref:hypothetical protein n=1 Tax=Streptomyces sp. NPDC058301 TaxID=3346436 RepID=UPI0036E2995E
MRLKRIAGTVAALGLAAAGVVGTAGTASAAVIGGCTHTYHSYYGAEYYICDSGTNHVYWVVGNGNATTDERFYVVVHDNCGNTNKFNWNDITQSTYNNTGYWMACNIDYAYIYPTEASRGQDGPTLWAI